MFDKKMVYIQIRPTKPSGELKRRFLKETTKKETWIGF